MRGDDLWLVGNGCSIWTCWSHGIVNNRVLQKSKATDRLSPSLLRLPLFLLIGRYFQMHFSIRNNIRLSLWFDHPHRYIWIVWLQIVGQVSSINCRSWFRDEKHISRILCEIVFQDKTGYFPGDVNRNKQKCIISRNCRLTWCFWVCIHVINSKRFQNQNLTKDEHFSQPIGIIHIPGNSPLIW
jgi:hypothetical protein